MLDILYQKLVENPIIRKECGATNRIKYYEIPETMESDGKPLIILSPLAPPKSTNYASNVFLSKRFTVQIDVQSNDRKLTKKLQHEIETQLNELEFYQLDGGLDEYFKDTKRFVDARRYQGITKLYDTDY